MERLAATSGSPGIAGQPELAPSASAHGGDPCAGAAGNGECRCSRPVPVDAPAAPASATPPAAHGRKPASRLGIGLGPPYRRACGFAAAATAPMRGASNAKCDAAGLPSAAARSVSMEAGQRRRQRVASLTARDQAADRAHISVPKMRHAGVSGRCFNGGKWGYSMHDDMLGRQHSTSELQDAPPRLQHQAEGCASTGVNVGGAQEPAVP